MRTYEIRNVLGHVVGVQTLEDSLAPSLLSGQTPHLTHIDGQAVLRPHDGKPLEAIPLSAAPAAAGVTAIKPEAAQVTKE